MTKQCHKCGETKEVSEFHKRAASKDGLQPRCKECFRQYRRDNAKDIKEYKRKWYLDNSAHKGEYLRQWRRANLDKTTAANHRRRARKLAAEGSYTAQDWADRLAFFGHRCLYCGTKDNLTVDHLTPLSRGGSNFPQNLAPACLSCNSKKGAKTVEEYLDTLS